MEGRWDRKVELSQKTDPGLEGVKKCKNLQLNYGTKLKDWSNEARTLQQTHRKLTIWTHQIQTIDHWKWRRGKNKSFKCPDRGTLDISNSL